MQISNHSCYLCTSHYSWVSARLRCMRSIETRENKGKQGVDSTPCLETAEKLGDIINHLLVIIFCGRGGSFVQLGGPLTLLCIASLFAMEFWVCVQNKTGEKSVNIGLSSTQNVTLRTTCIINLWKYEAFLWLELNSHHVPKMLH